MEPIDLLDVGLPQAFTLWNMQHLQSVMNWSAIMWCAWTPIYITRLCHPTKEETKMLGGPEEEGKWHWFDQGSMERFSEEMIIELDLHKSDSQKEAWWAPEQYDLSKIRISSTAINLNCVKATIWLPQGHGVLWSWDDFVLNSILFKNSEWGSGRNDLFFSFCIILYSNSHYWGL